MFHPRQFSTHVKHVGRFQPAISLILLNAEATYGLLGTGVGGWGVGGDGGDGGGGVGYI